MASGVAAGAAVTVGAGTLAAEETEAKQSNAAKFRLNYAPSYGTRQEQKGY